MLLIRPAFWSALLPRFPVVFGRRCSQVVPTFCSQVWRLEKGTRQHQDFHAAHDRVAVGIAAVHARLPTPPSNC